MARINYESFFTSKAMLESRCRVNSSDLVKLKIEATEQGVDVYELVTVLMQKWVAYRKSVGDDENLDSIKLQAELQSEKLLRERINNQARLGVLIPKAEAVNRVLRLLTKYREVVMEVIRSIATERTALGAEQLKPTTRAWVEYLTTHFNKVVDRVIADKNHIISWEEDGSYKLLRTRLLAADAEADVDKILFDQTIQEVDL